MTNALSFLGLAVSLCALIAVFVQIRVSVQANRASVLAGVIDQLYADKDAQQVLKHIYREELTFNLDISTQRAEVQARSDETVLTSQVDLLLNRLQVLGHLFSLGVLRLPDFGGVRFEILATCRNNVIREYLRYCNTAVIERSGIEHDHFGFLKQLYLHLEYDARQREAFCAAIPRSCRPSGFQRQYLQSPTRMSSINEKRFESSEA